MDCHNYANKQIINMDESAIYLDALSNYTFAVRGSKRVKAGTAGGERVRLSTAFTATASGLKLPIYAIIPRLTSIPEIQEVEQLLPQYKNTSIFDTDTYIDYLKKVVVNYKEHHFLERVLLVLDHAACHETKPVSF